MSALAILHIKLGSSLGSTLPVPQTAQKGTTSHGASPFGTVKDLLEYLEENTGASPCHEHVENSPLVPPVLRIEVGESAVREPHISELLGRSCELST